MVLDRVFRTAWRSFSTLYGIVALVTIPLNLAYAAVFRRVIALAPTFAAIGGVPEHGALEGIGADEVGAARLWFAVLVVAEAALLPVMARAAACAIEAEATGELPGILRSYARALSRRRSAGGGVDLAAVALAAAPLYSCSATKSAP